MKQTQNSGMIEIWTEGKTDWMHLKAAMRGLGLHLPIAFNEEPDSIGDTKLLQMCQSFAKRQNATPVVFMFDRDNPSIVDQVSGPDDSYKSWGNEVYSFALPIPKHRKGYQNICIEMFYSDDELKTVDENGRRLFLTSEFHPVSGKHKEDKTLSVENKHHLKGLTAIKSATIKDIKVYDGNDSNIALNKSSFAKMILDEIPLFHTFDFEAFRAIFEIISGIVRSTRPTNTVYLPDLDNVIKSLESKTPAEQLFILCDTLYQISSMILQMYGISTIRVYEESIGVNKDKSIQRILEEDFFSPTLKTLLDLAKKCFYFTDDDAPEGLLRMKVVMEQVFKFEELGQVLDDLEIMFPPPSGTARRLNKANRQNTLLRYFQELAAYEARVRRKLADVAPPLLASGEIRLETWRQAIQQITEICKPLFSYPIIFRNAQYLSSDGKYGVETLTYSDYDIKREVTEYQEQELDNTFEHVSQLQLEPDILIYLYPMLLVKQGALYCYQRTSGLGYEYFSLVHDRIHIERTKKKFNYAMFRTGSQQELFWTDVPPTVNEKTKIKANIPREGLDRFIGREEQLQMILKDIIEVPNENGIVYASGGMGKTALMQMVTMKLYEDPDCADHQLENIIWISAKTNYYDHIFDTIEPKEHNFKSFEDITTAILEFFEYEGLEEYSFDEKNSLLLEVFEENSTLLILDNFETIQVNSPKEAEDIIQFFGSKIKKHLRNHPFKYKIIITSRIQIPSGFKQVPLGGLSQEEAKQLIDQLLKRYRVDLTEKQKEDIYEATQGIPIVILHFFGQVHEFRRPLSRVLRELSSYDSDIIQFSHKEILESIESEDANEIKLDILLLLEILKYPLMVEQFSEILGTPNREVENSLEQLTRFQCIRAVRSLNHEKYTLNHEIKMLTHALSQRYSTRVNELRNKALTSSAESDFDATTDELNSVRLFETYKQQGQTHEAENFIEEQLKKFPQSALLNYHHANFLISQHDYNGAISILEAILETYENNQRVLSQLVYAYSRLSVPVYAKAKKYVTMLESWTRSDNATCIQVGSFYRDWAMWMKSSPPPAVGWEHAQYIKKYKDIAQRGLDIIQQVPKSERTGQHYYIIAQCQYCKWEYDKADQAITKAIATAESDSKLGEYRHFDKTIRDAKEEHSRR